MREVNAELRKVQSEYDGMTKVLEAFNVMAPEDGMVIYHRGWDGKPIKSGSRVQMWDPTVATLPDLTTMMSKTYVNEVDVRKVQKGQTVELGLDAYPEKKLAGQVMSVANVGEQRPNSDAKVFEVLIEINGTDPTLRPSMTTSNKIVAEVQDSVLYVPLESLHTQADTITYVFKKDGINTTKQEVMVGATNANNAIILGGIDASDKIYLSIPPGLAEEKIKLLPQMEGKRGKKEEEPAPAAKVLSQAASN